MQKIFAVLILSCSLMRLQAQTPPRYPLHAGFSFVGISYTGDYSDGASSLSRVYPGANLSLQSSNPRALKLQMNAGFGKFAEQYDTDSPNIPAGVEIPTFIETSFIYGDLRLKYHFFNTRNFQPFISAGAGVMFFSPKDQKGRKLTRRSSTRLEGEDFNDIIPELPLSAGIQFHLTRQVWMEASYTYRYTPTDYLDNVGLAGENNGFDALHSVQLGIHISLGPKPELDQINTVPASPEIEAGQDSMSQPSDEPGTETSIPPAPQSQDLAGQEESDFKQKAEEALENEDFIYYRVKKGDSLESLSKKFYLSEEKIRKINFIQKPKIKPGTMLRLPNIGIDY